MSETGLPGLISYNRAQGIPDDQIRSRLLAKGWSAEDVNGAFAKVALDANPYVLGKRGESPPRSAGRSSSLPVIATLIILIGVAYGAYTHASLLEVMGADILATFIEAPSSITKAVFVPFNALPSDTYPTGSAPALSPTHAPHSPAEGTSGPVTPAVPSDPTPPVTVPSSGPPTVTLQADATKVTALTPVILTWSSTGATTCRASTGFSTRSQLAGSAEVRPLLTTSYSVTCSGSNGTAKASVLIYTTLEEGVHEGGVSQGSQPVPDAPGVPPLTPGPVSPPTLPSLPPIVPTPVPVGSTGTYYVDFASGLDTNAGSASAPWKHAPGDANATGVAASAKLLPGNLVQFKGGVTYYGSVKVPASGTASAPITYSGSGWGSGKAIIDGSQPITTWMRCSSGADCGGNPNWANIYKATVTVPSFLTREPEIRLNLTQGDQVIIPAQTPLSTSRYYQNHENYYSVPPSSVTTTTLTDSRIDALGGSALVGSWI
jgi:hypothetical protein